MFRLDPKARDFQIPNVLPGNYDLDARVEVEPQGPGERIVTWGSAAIEVRDHDLENVALTVHDSVAVRGKILVDQQAPGDTFLAVSLEPVGFSRFDYFDQNSDVWSKLSPDGSFMIPRVAADHYRFNFRGVSGNLYGEDIRQGGITIYDSGITITERVPEPIEVFISSAGGEIEGTVMSGPKPARKAEVVLVPLPSRRVNRGLYKNATTDDQGRFSLSGIRPGEYKLFAWETLPDGAWLNAEFLANYEAQGRPINVVSTATQKVALPVIPR